MSTHQFLTNQSIFSFFPLFWKTTNFLVGAKDVENGCNEQRYKRELYEKLLGEERRMMDIGWELQHWTSLISNLRLDIFYEKV